MTQKKRIASKLFLLVLVMTLISCCFLGSTFARYTSGESGTGTLKVAKWDIQTTQTAGFTIDFTTLSPSKEAYVDTARTHSTGKVKVAEITNNGEVDALVTLTTGTEPTLTCSGGYGTSGVATDGIPTEAECKEVFTIKWYTNTTDDMAGAAEYAAAVNLTAGGGELYVYAEVVWTSDTTITGATADVRDTWIGENVTQVSFDLSYTAVQNSQIPA